MKLSSNIRTTTRNAVIVSMLFIGVQAPAMAAMVDTPALGMQADLQIQRDALREFIARDEVRAALLEYGVSAADAEARIDQLNPDELLQMQNQITQLPAGGGVLGVVVGVILIFVLLDLLGATDVFPRI